MRNLNFRTLSFVWCLMLLVSSVYSQTGSSGFIILRRAQSSKPKSLAAVGSVRGDLSGILYNPALIATLDSNEMFIFGETGLTEGARQGGAIYAKGLKNSGISAGILNFDAGKEELFSYVPGRGIIKQSSSFQNDVLVIVNYGRSFKKFKAGVSLKYVTSKIAGTKSNSAIVMDLGLMYEIKNIPYIREISYSVAIQNLGKSNSFVSKEEKLPVNLMFGISTHYKNFYSGINFDYLLTENRILTQLGLEYSIYKFVSLAAAYQFGVQDGNILLGLYCSYMRFDLGYSYVFYRDLTPIHRFALGFRF